MIYLSNSKPSFQEEKAEVGVDLLGDSGSLSPEFRFLLQELF